MKTKAMCLLALALLAGLTFANVDTLHIELIDSLDAPSNYEFFHYGITEGWPIEYSYSGTGRWDLAMGDSFMVWLPGSQRILFLDAYETSEVDTIANFRYGSVNATGVTICDSIIYLVGGGGINTLRFRTDSLILIGFGYTPWASYHFAALEDSFLYTINLSGMDTTGLTCINVANPESIFIYRGVADGGAKLGLEVIDGYAYSGFSGSLRDSPYGRAWPIFHLYKTDMINSDTPGPVSGGRYSENRCLGSICSDGEFIYFVNSEMSDGPSWTIGGSDLFVLGTDTSYSFDSRWDGQGVFGVDVIGENLLAVGFEYGVSVLNISNLDSIYESAFYFDTLGAMDITHFAIKEDRLYAMGHPRDGYATLYMFRLDDCVISGQCELDPLPWDFKFYNYPNPFNSECKLVINSDNIYHDSQLEIFDITGRQVYSEKIPLKIGTNSFTWRPENSPSGLYLARVVIGEFSFTAKLVYLA